MNKLHSGTHGLIDFMVVIFLIFSPVLFDLPYYSSLFSYALATMHLFLTIFTKYEVGLYNFISFPVHDSIELVISFLLIIIAFLMGSLEGAYSRNFFLGVASGIFIIWLITDYSYFLEKKYNTHSKGHT